MRRNIREAVGVPENIGPVARKIYDEVLKFLSTKNNIAPDEQLSLVLKNKNGEYSFADFNPKKIVVDIELQTYEGEPQDSKGNPIEGGIITSLGHSKNMKFDDVFNLVPSDDTRNVNLEISYAQPVSDQVFTGQKIIDTLTREGEKPISSLGHEMKHAYDVYKKPLDNIKKRSTYSSLLRHRSGIKPLDMFMYSLYFINHIENLVRPTELYIDMVEDGVKTKEEFLKFLLDTKTYHTLLECRDMTYEKFFNSLKPYEKELDEYLKQRYDEEAGFDLSKEPIDNKIRVVLNDFAEEFADNVFQTRKNMLTPNFMEMLFGSSKDYGGYLSKNINDVIKIRKNPANFYKKSIKGMNYIGNKMIKKLSKLYSLLMGDKTIKIEHVDPINFEMDQLMRKTKSRVIETKLKK